MSSPIPGENTVRLTIDGRSIDVLRGTTVAAAVVSADLCCRESVSGERRGPLCGMGVCFECRVTIDGRPHQRGCMTLCKEDMEVATHA